LVEIDKLRDAYGRIDDEPRHPDIASGEPWHADAPVLGGEARSNPPTACSALSRPRSVGC
jgi:hypothetical protein